MERTVLADAVSTAAKQSDDQRLVWAEQRALHEAVVGLVEANQCAPARGPDATVIDTLDALLGAAEARSALRGRDALLGVRCADVEGDLARRRAQVALIQRTVIPMLESRLHRTLASLALLAGEEQDDVTAVRTAARATSALRQRAADEVAALEAALREVATAQGALVTELCDALQNQRMGSVAEWDAVYAQWLLAQAEAMGSKMRLLQLRLEADTYTSKEAVQALRKMSAEIEAAQSALVEKQSRVAQRRARFEAAGLPEMESLAAEYARVLKATEETQWALNQLK